MEPPAPSDTSRQPDGGGPAPAAPPPPAPPGKGADAAGGKAGGGTGFFMPLSARIPSHGRQKPQRRRNASTSCLQPPRERGLRSATSANLMLNMQAAASQQLQAQQLQAQLQQLQARQQLQAQAQAQQLQQLASVELAPYDAVAGFAPQPPLAASPPGLAHCVGPAARVSPFLGTSLLAGPAGSPRHAGSAATETALLGTASLPTALTVVSLPMQAEPGGVHLVYQASGSLQQLPCSSGSSSSSAVTVAHFVAPPASGGQVLQQLPAQQQQPSQQPSQQLAADGHGLAGPALSAAMQPSQGLFGGGGLPEAPATLNGLTLAHLDAGPAASFDGAALLPANGAASLEGDQEAQLQQRIDKLVLMKQLLQLKQRHKQQQQLLQLQQQQQEHLLQQQLLDVEQSLLSGNAGATELLLLLQQQQQQQADDAARTAAGSVAATSVAQPVQGQATGLVSLGGSPSPDTALLGASAQPAAAGSDLRSLLHSKLNLADEVVPAPTAWKQQAPLQPPNGGVVADAAGTLPGWGTASFDLARM